MNSIMKLLELDEWYIGGAAIAVFLVGAAIPTFNGGLELEAGGVAVLLDADLERGLQLTFQAIEQARP